VSACKTVITQAYINSKTYNINSQIELTRLTSLLMPNLTNYADNINLPDPVRFVNFVNLPDLMIPPCFMGLSDFMQGFYSINGSDLIKGFDQMKGIFSKKFQKERIIKRG